MRGTGRKWMMTAGLLAAAALPARADEPPSLPPPSRSLPQMASGESKDASSVTPASAGVQPVKQTRDGRVTERRRGDVGHVTTLPPAQSGSSTVSRPPIAATGEAVVCEVVVPESRWARFKRGVQSCFLGYPEEFVAAPLGQSLFLHGRMQVGNGEAARMVLYNYDFVKDEPVLNNRGKDQLTKIADLLPQNFAPVIVERTLDMPQLSEARRQVVLAELQKGPFPVPAERVVIGPPVSNGLSGVEAVEVNTRLMKQTQQGGSRVLPLTTGGGTAEGESTGSAEGGAK